MNRVFIDMDGVLADFSSMKKRFGMESDQFKKMAGAYLMLEPMPGALEAVKSLLEDGYDVFVATKPPTGIAQAYAEKAMWVLNYLPELSRKIIITHDKGLLGDEGDFLVDDRPNKANCDQFKGTFIPFINGETWIGVLDKIKAKRYTN